jgi:lipoyl(octanoyl) transferase
MPRTGRLIRPTGLVPYAEANETMHALAEARLRGEGEDTLILLEHPPVYTAGRTSKDEHVVWTEEQIRAAGAELHSIDRGGSLTFHGPGQLVGYPIVDLGSRPEALAYVRQLEEVVIEAAADVGVELHRSAIQTGVWSGDRKVCAIGVRLMRMRVSLHGFALNCTNDLSWFDAIVPCGLCHTGVTSMSELAGRVVTVAEMASIVARRFGEVFDLRFEQGARAWPMVAPAPAAVS